MLNSCIVSGSVPIPHNDQIMKPLQNDACSKTLKLESDFLTPFGLEEYTYNLDNTSTVITSRTLKTSYIWPKSKPLTANMLEIFSENGHTLGIDYTSTYCRMFALDLDCICRKSSTFDHLNENIVSRIIIVLNELFQQMINTTPTFSVWRNGCGYHLYSDILVSMPTHLYIKKQLEATVEFIDSACVFEVPNTMPLPFSAKIRGAPYTLNIQNAQAGKMALTICKDKQDCLELFFFTQLAVNGRTAAKLTTLLGTEYLVKLSTPTIRRTPPKIINMSAISLYPNFMYMDQFEKYAILMAKQHNIQTTKIEDIDFKDFTADERAQIRLFMSSVNKLFGVGDAHGQESCSTFINLAAFQYGGLYLQPFVAGFFLYLQNVGLFVNFDKFRLLLKKIFYSAMEQYASVKQFVKLVNIQSLQAYSGETGDSIINHLYFMISYSTTPLQTIDQQINSIMEKMTDSTADYVRENIRIEFAKKDKTIGENLINDLLEKFKIIFLEMKILYFDQSSSRYYSLDPVYGAKYESSAKLDTYLYPATIRSWIGHSKPAVAILKTQLEDAHFMHINEPVNFAQTDYMFSTQVGVFNSATGLYTARSRFLRFSKFRHTSIWPFDHPQTTFYAQNQTILEHYVFVADIIKKINNSLFEIYTHCVFAPAIIQLNNLMSISEKHISQIITILSNHKNYEPAYFLLEYFPFNPKMIYLILHLCDDFGGIECFISYKTLCIKVFKTEHVEPKDWSDKFGKIMDEAKFDTNQTTQLEKLKSLKGEHAVNCPDALYLFATVVLACITKCNTFVDFVKILKISQPTTVYKDPRYEKFNNSTNLASMKSNMIRARSIVFGENVTQFQNTLIDELLSICMSADFKPETVVNYLTAVGSMYIPLNVLKKLLLIHGDQDVGKSLACKKITAIAEPSSARFDDISAVIARSSVAEYSAIILNEATYLNASQLKIVTGNDDTSSMKFYSQKYELQRMQTHMFGATNLHVSFKSKEDVDKTSVSRLYAIQFTGVNCPAASPQSSFISMMVDGLYFSGIFSPIHTHAIEALKWLSFGMYMHVRDVNYFPKLDLSCSTCKQYQHIVHYNNSALYKKLVDSGITDAPGFSIRKEQLLNIIRANLDKAGGPYPSISKFKTVFEKQYNISFENVTHIKHFQQVGLILHVKNNMLATEEPNSTIKHEDITNRLKLYTVAEDKDNAMEYFQRTYEKYFDYDKICYKGITFVSEDPCCSDKFDGYSGNNSNMDTTDENSLVMQSV